MAGSMFHIDPTKVFFYVIMTKEIHPDVAQNGRDRSLFRVRAHNYVRVCGFESRRPVYTGVAQ